MFERMKTWLHTSTSPQKLHHSPPDRPEDSRQNLFVSLSPGSSRSLSESQDGSSLTSPLQRNVRSLSKCSATDYSEVEFYDLTADDEVQTTMTLKNIKSQKNSGANSSTGRKRGRPPKKNLAVSGDERDGLGAESGLIEAGLVDGPVKKKKSGHTLKKSSGVSCDVRDSVGAELSHTEMIYVEELVTVMRDSALRPNSLIDCVVENNTVLPHTMVSSVSTSTGTSSRVNSNNNTIHKLRKLLRTPSYKGSVSSTNCRSDSDSEVTHSPTKSSSDTAFGGRNVNSTMCNPVIKDLAAKLKPVVLKASMTSAVQNLTKTQSVVPLNKTSAIKTLATNKPHSPIILNRLSNKPAATNCNISLDASCVRNSTSCMRLVPASKSRSSLIDTNATNSTPGHDIAPRASFSLVDSCVGNSASNVDTAAVNRSCFDSVIDFLDTCADRSKDLCNVNKNNNKVIVIDSDSGEDCADDCILKSPGIAKQQNNLSKLSTKKVPAASHEKKKLNFKAADDGRGSGKTVIGRGTVEKAGQQHEGCSLANKHVVGVPNKINVVNSSVMEESGEVEGDEEDVVCSRLDRTDRQAVSVSSSKQIFSNDNIVHSVTLKKLDNGQYFLQNYEQSIEASQSDSGRSDSIQHSDSVSHTRRVYRVDSELPYELIRCHVVLKRLHMLDSMSLIQNKRFKGISSVSDAYVVEDEQCNQNEGANVENAASGVSGGGCNSRQSIENVPTTSGNNRELIEKIPTTSTQKFKSNLSGLRQRVKEAMKENVTQEVIESVNVCEVIEVMDNEVSNEDLSRSSSSKSSSSSSYVNLADKEKSTKNSEKEGIKLKSMKTIDVDIIKEKLTNIVSNKVDIEKLMEKVEVIKEKLTENLEKQVKFMETVTTSVNKVISKDEVGANVDSIKDKLIESVDEIDDKEFCEMYEVEGDVEESGVLMVNCDVNKSLESESSQRVEVFDSTDDRLVMSVNVYKHDAGESSDLISMSSDIVSKSDTVQELIENSTNYDAGVESAISTSVSSNSLVTEILIVSSEEGQSGSVDHSVSETSIILQSSVSAANTNIGICDINVDNSNILSNSGLSSANSGLVSCDRNDLSASCNQINKFVCVTGNISQDSMNAPTVNSEVLQRLTLLSPQNNKSCSESNLTKVDPDSVSMMGTPSVDNCIHADPSSTSCEDVLNTTSAIDDVRQAERVSQARSVESTSVVSTMSISEECDARSVSSVLIGGRDLLSQSPLVDNIDVQSNACVDKVKDSSRKDVFDSMRVTSSISVETHVTDSTKYSIVTGTGETSNAGETKDASETSEPCITSNAGETSNTSEKSSSGETSNSHKTCGSGGTNSAKVNCKTGETNNTFETSNAVETNQSDETFSSKDVNDTNEACKPDLRSDGDKTVFTDIQTRRNEFTDLTNVIKTAYDNAINSGLDMILTNGETSAECVDSVSTTSGCCNNSLPVVTNKEEISSLSRETKHLSLDMHNLNTDKSNVISSVVSSGVRSRTWIKSRRKAHKTLKLLPRTKTTGRFGVSSYLNFRKNWLKNYCRVRRCKISGGREKNKVPISVTSSKEAAQSEVVEDSSVCMQRVEAGNGESVTENSLTCVDAVKSSTIEVNTCENSSAALVDICPGNDENTDTAVVSSSCCSSGSHAELLNAPCTGTVVDNNHLSSELNKIKINVSALSSDMYDASSVESSIIENTLPVEPSNIKNSITRSDKVENVTIIGKTCVDLLGEESELNVESFEQKNDNCSNSNLGAQNCSKSGDSRPNKPVTKMIAVKHPATSSESFAMSTNFLDSFLKFVEVPGRKLLNEGEENISDSENVDESVNESSAVEQKQTEERKTEEDRSTNDSKCINSKSEAVVAVGCEASKTEAANQDKVRVTVSQCDNSQPCERVTVKLNKGNKSKKGVCNSQQRRAVVNGRHLSKANKQKMIYFGNDVVHSYSDVVSNNSINEARTVLNMDEVLDSLSLGADGNMIGFDDKIWELCAVIDHGADGYDASQWDEDNGSHNNIEGNVGLCSEGNAAAGSDGVGGGVGGMGGVRVDGNYLGVRTSSNVIVPVSGGSSQKRGRKGKLSRSNRSRSVEDQSQDDGRMVSTSSSTLPVSTTQDSAPDSCGKVTEVSTANPQVTGVPMADEQATVPFPLSANVSSFASPAVVCETSRAQGSQSGGRSRRMKRPNSRFLDFYIAETPGLAEQLTSADIFNKVDADPGQRKKRKMSDDVNSVSNDNISTTVLPDGSLNVSSAALITNQNASINDSLSTANISTNSGGATVAHGKLNTVSKPVDMFEATGCRNGRELWREMRRSERLRTKVCRLLAGLLSSSSAVVSFPAPCGLSEQFVIDLVDEMIQFLSPDVRGDKCSDKLVEMEKLEKKVNRKIETFEKDSTVEVSQLSNCVSVDVEVGLDKKEDNVVKAGQDEKSDSDASFPTMVCSLVSPTTIKLKSTLLKSVQATSGEVHPVQSTEDTINTSEISKSSTSSLQNKAESEKSSNIPLNNSTDSAVEQDKLSSSHSDSQKTSNLESCQQTSSGTLEASNPSTTENTNTTKFHSIDSKFSPRVVLCRHPVQQCTQEFRKKVFHLLGLMIPELTSLGMGPEHSEILLDTVISANQFGTDRVTVLQSPRKEKVSSQNLSPIKKELDSSKVKQEHAEHGVKQRNSVSQVSRLKEISASPRKIQHLSHMSVDAKSCQRVIQNKELVRSKSFSHHKRVESFNSGTVLRKISSDFVKHKNIKLCGNSGNLARLSLSPEKLKLHRDDRIKKCLTSLSADRGSREKLHGLKNPEKLHAPKYETDQKLVGNRTDNSKAHQRVGCVSKVTVGDEGNKINERVLSVCKTSGESGKHRHTSEVDRLTGTDSKKHQNSDNRELRHRHDSKTDTKVTEKGHTSNVSHMSSASGSHNSLKHDSKTVSRVKQGSHVSNASHCASKLDKNSGGSVNKHVSNTSSHKLGNSNMSSNSTMRIITPKPSSTSATVSSTTSRTSTLSTTPKLPSSTVSSSSTVSKTSTLLTTPKLLTSSSANSLATTPRNTSVSASGTPKIPSSSSKIVTQSELPSTPIPKLSNTFSKPVIMHKPLETPKSCDVKRADSTSEQHDERPKTRLDVTEGCQNTNNEEKKSSRSVQADAPVSVKADSTLVHTHKAGDSCLKCSLATKSATDKEIIERFKLQNPIRTSTNVTDLIDSLTADKPKPSQSNQDEKRVLRSGDDSSKSLSDFRKKIALSIGRFKEKRLSEAGDLSSASEVVTRVSRSGTSESRSRASLPERINSTEDLEGAETETTTRNTRSSKIADVNSSSAKL